MRTAQIGPDLRLALKDWWDKNDVTWFLRGQRSEQICQSKLRNLSLFFLDNKKWRTFHLKDRRANDRNVLPVSIKWSLLTLTFVVFIGVDHSASELIEPFQRFIESSTLGEFTSRVQMLFTFYKEMCNEEGRTSALEGNLWPVNKTPLITASHSW